MLLARFVVCIAAVARRDCRMFVCIAAVARRDCRMFVCIAAVARRDCRMFMCLVGVRPCYSRARLSMASTSITPS